MSRPMTLPTWRSPRPAAAAWSRRTASYATVPVCAARCASSCPAASRRGRQSAEDGDGSGVLDAVVDQVQLSRDAQAHGYPFPAAKGGTVTGGAAYVIDSRTI